MSDLMFLFNRKGALYPIDFESAAFTEATLSGGQSGKVDWPFASSNAAAAGYSSNTLVYLSARQIVAMPKAEIDRITDILPVELFIPLFKASLYPVRDDVIDILVGKWPYKSLSVSKFLGNMFSSLVAFYSDAEMAQRTRLGIKYSADIVHSFIEALRQRRTKLRQLDLTGLPIAEIIIKYVATHCRLAQKEHQRNCLIDEYLQNVSDLESLHEKTNELSTSLNTIANSIKEVAAREKQQEQKEEEAVVSDEIKENQSKNEECSTITATTTSPTVPEQQSSITAQPVLPLTSNTLLATSLNKSNLSRNDLKKTTSLPDEPLIFKFDCILQERATLEELIGALDHNGSNFCLQICKLELLCIGKAYIKRLLDKIDKMKLEGLRLQYNSLTEESLVDVLPLITQLRNLSCLDLSCNLIDFRQNLDTTLEMSRALSQLEHLERLDLSGSPISGCLSVLLGGVSKPLRFLSLHTCNIHESDLLYLSNSKHVTVEHLDLGENRLTRFSDALVVLLKRCSPHLRILELDENRFDCIDYLTIICIARKMPNLKVLATKGTFEKNDHLLSAEFLHHSASLHAWRISFPVDIYDPNQPDLRQNDQKKEFLAQLNTVVKDKFKIIVNELFY